MLPFLDSPVPFLCGMYKDPIFKLQALGIRNEEHLFKSYPSIVFLDVDKVIMKCHS
jgi:hypothetical protein